MKVLVIPDVHLKPEIFQYARALMHQKIATRAVCLMDIADDWDKEYDIKSYEDTYDEAIKFAKEYPDTAWCYGNHDLSYRWHQLESGYSSMASYTVQKKLIELASVLPEGQNIQYIHRIDDVLFSHGGLSEMFVRNHVSPSKYDDVDYVLQTINNLGRSEMWKDDSPIWLRPQYGEVKLYKPRKLLQVVGHTPVKYIVKTGNLISCDVFSTYIDGSPIGTGELLVLDTQTWEFFGV